MVQTSLSSANIFNIFSGGSLLPGHTVYILLSCTVSPGVVTQPKKI